MVEGTLLIHDSRTATEYEIHINRKQLCPRDNDSEHSTNGLLDPEDPGIQSKVAYINGEKKVILLRTQHFEQLWNSELEELIHSLVWGSPPSIEEKGKIPRANSMESEYVKTTTSGKQHFRGKRLHNHVHFAEGAEIIKC